MILEIKNFKVTIIDGHLEYAEYIPTGRDVTELLMDIDWESVYHKEKNERSYERWKNMLLDCSYISNEVKEELL